jgi:hypothetical protein
MNEFEEESESKEYNCPTCGLVFKNRFSLNAHQKVHRRHERGESGAPPSRPIEPLDADRIAEETLERVRGIINKRLRLEIESLAGAALKGVLSRMAGIPEQSAIPLQQSQQPSQILPQNQNIPSLSEIEYARLIREIREKERAEREALESQRKNVLPYQPQPMPPYQQMYQPTPQDIKLLEKLEELRRENEKMKSEYQKEIQSLKEAFEKKEQEREREELLKKIESLEESNRSLSAKFNEVRESMERGRDYQSDEVRFLAQTLHEGIEVLKERKPMSDIAKVLEKLSEQPPQKELPPGAGKTLAEELPPEYVEYVELKPKQPSPPASQ